MDAFFTAAFGVTSREAVARLLAVSSRSASDVIFAAIAVLVGFVLMVGWAYACFGLGTSWAASQHHRLLDNNGARSTDRSSGAATTVRNPCVRRVAPVLRLFFAPGTPNHHAASIAAGVRQRWCTGPTDAPSLSLCPAPSPGAAQHGSRGSRRRRRPRPRPGPKID